MDRTATACDTAMRDFEIEIMLLINDRLYQKGGITAEMYIKAKEMILRS